MATAESLQKLLDVQEIQTILSKYVIAVDTREFSLFDDCFSADATIDLANTGVFTRDSYRDLCRQVLPTLDATQHHLGLPVIDVQGDRAFSRCYFIAQHARNSLAPNPFVLIGGWYDDELARVNGQWRIIRRLGTAVWFDGNPDVLGYPFPPGALEQVSGRACPQWLLPR